MLLLPLALVLTLTACNEPTGPGELEAGLHRARIPAPLGIGTTGFSASSASTSVSPYADVYPATYRLHGHPDIRVVALSQGPGYEVILVRLDLFAVTEQLRRAVVTTLFLRTGIDFDDTLILGATRTQAGPGRMGGIKDRFELGADSFLPTYQAALVGAIVDAVLAARDDLQPARIGTGLATVDGAWEDVRCEDGLDDTDPSVPLLAIEREGQVEALVMASAITGGAVPIGELTLSNDVSGAVEQAVEDRFDHSVMAMLFNGATADADFTDPEDDIGNGGVQSTAFDHLDALGQVAADGIEAGLDSLVWDTPPTLEASTTRYFLDRDVMDYRTLDFPFEFGADQCLGGTGCTAPETDKVLDNDCSAFPAEDPAPKVAELTVAQVGSFTVVSFPGDISSQLAADLIARAQADHGAGDVLLLGNSQGYMGVSLAETDWWYGGDEARGSFWGQKQGDFLANAVVEVIGRQTGSLDAVSWEEPPAVALLDVGEERLEVNRAIDGGELYDDVDSSYTSTDRIAFTVQGGDPLLGAPLARLLDADGDRVRRPGDQPYDSDDQSFTIDIGMTPAWDAGLEATDRTFYWTFAFLPQRKVPGVVDLPSGTYRFEIEVPLDGGTSRTVQTSTFTYAAD
jgi:hypothetical protein